MPAPNASRHCSSFVKCIALWARRASQLPQLALLLWAPIVACQEAPKEATSSRGLNTQEATLAALVCETYANLAYASYGDSVAGVERLLTAVNTLIAAPTRDALVAARQAWLDARQPYQQTEVFRFYDGPIDAVETLVNTWPIDENFVESGASGAKPGIIENSTTYPVLSSQLLASVNMTEGETSVSTGYHVIEFLLWGRDENANGPGDRPFTDYEVIPSIPPKHVAGWAANADAQKSPNNPTEITRQRRGAYLRAATELLLENLKQVHAAWAPGQADNFRGRFLKMPPNRALALVLKGMGALSGSELAGERLTVAYETKDQENEHSCFSDTTHTDLWLDTRGLQNVCLGRYESPHGSAVNGRGLCDLVSLRDSEVGGRLRSEIEQSVDAVRSIPAPFDQSILGTDDAPGRQAIETAIARLQRQTRTLAEVASLFDVRSSQTKGVTK